MAYVVTDGKTRKEFDTLKEAIEYRKGVPMPVFRSDGMGNLNPIRMAEISAAVEQEDKFEPVESVPSLEPVPLTDTKGMHAKTTLIFILAGLSIVIVLALLWFVMRSK